MRNLNYYSVYLIYKCNAKLLDILSGYDVCYKMFCKEISVVGDVKILMDIVFLLCICQCVFGCVSVCIS